MRQLCERVGILMWDQWPSRVSRHPHEVRSRAGTIQQRMSGPKQEDIYSLRRRGSGDNRQFITYTHKD